MTRTIRFLVYPDFQILDAAGPLSAFEAANGAEVIAEDLGWVPEYGFLRIISAAMPIQTISAKRD